MYSEDIGLYMQVKPIRYRCVFCNEMVAVYNTMQNMAASTLIKYQMIRVAVGELLRMLSFKDVFCETQI